MKGERSFEFVVNRDSGCVFYVVNTIVFLLRVLPRTRSGRMIKTSKGRFTRYDFVAYNKLTTGLRHDLGPFSEL